MQSVRRILVIDDDPAMLSLAKHYLAPQGYEVMLAGSGEQCLKLVDENRFDLALVDFQLPDWDGIELIRKLKDVAPETDIIMITGFSSVSRAVEAIRAGAFYYIEKPIDFDELLLLVEKVFERREQADEIRQLRNQLGECSSYYDIIGSSKAMQQIYQTIESVAASDANVLIIGESGTGKELIARAIHYRSHRARKPYLQVNCAALPKELIESELFGHTKGAFTGASGEKTGLIGRVAGGSLLLDEISEMPVELQPKLLRVLQERVYYRVGSEKQMEADFRLIAATNRNPVEALREGRLREDLYYRINTIEIRVPPLRDRPEDVQKLADHFLRLYAEKYDRKVHSISQEAYQRMFDYPWPGNVRELQNAMERAVLIAREETIELSHLPFARNFAPGVKAEAQVEAAESAEAAGVAAPPAARTAAEPREKQTLEGLCREIIRLVPEPQPGEAANDLFKQLEIHLARAALERTKGNKHAAASLLGIYRPRLYSLLRKYGELQQEEGQGESDEGAEPKAASRGDGKRASQAAKRKVGGSRRQFPV